MEGGTVEPEKKRNMKKKEADLSQATADIEVEIEKLKKAALEAKRQSPGPIISGEAIEKLKEDLDKEMTNAFISMGLQEKLESLKMELSKSSSNLPDETLSPALKEKADKLMQEFKHNLSHPGSYLGLKQKLQMLSEVNKLGEQTTKGEKLKREINEKLHDQVKGKMEILKMARNKLAKGEQLDEDEIKEVNMVLEDVKEMLESLNLEVVGSGKKIVPTAPPVLEDKLSKADEVVKMEIAKAIETAGLTSKIDKLKEEIAKGASKETVEKLANDIREGIIANMDLSELKKKVASTVELPLEETVDAGTQ